MSSKQIGKKRELAFLGIDVAKKTHWGQLLSADGIEIGRPFSFNRRTAGLEKALKQLEGVEHPVAGLESTGPFGKNLIRFLEDNGVKVIEINPIETKTEGAKRVRKVKTDKVDALNIARVTREKYFKGHSFSVDRDLEIAKIYGRCRDSFIDHQRQLKQQIRSQLVVANPGLEECLDLWSVSGMAILRRWPTVDRLKKAEHDQVAATLVKASRGQFKPQKVDQIIEHCSRFYISSDEEHHRGMIIKKLMRQLDQLIEDEQQIRGKQEKLIRPQELELMESIIGLGDGSIPTILAERGPNQNFTSSRQFAAFAGLDPSVNESGESKRPGRMSKRGSPTLRNALYRATFNASQHNPVIRLIYLRKKVLGKKETYARSVAARHLSLVIQNVLSTGERFFVPEKTWDELEQLELLYEKATGKENSRRLSLRRPGTG